MRFEWDDRKARSNAVKHGVTFEQAMTVFDSPVRWVGQDHKHSSTAERREWLIGRSDDDRLLVVTFTSRMGGEAIRIITARRAGRRDRRKYDKAARSGNPISVEARAAGNGGGSRGSTEGH